MAVDGPLVGLTPPLRLFLDEIANVVPLLSLPNLMSFAGGFGIFIAAIVQSRAQAEARWDVEQAAMLWGAATVKLILGGLSGAELRDLSENLVGEHDRQMTTYQRSDDGSITTGTSAQQHKTMTVEEIRTLGSADRDPDRTPLPEAAASPWRRPQTRTGPQSPGGPRRPQARPRQPSAADRLRPSRRRTPAQGEDGHRRLPTPGRLSTDTSAPLPRA